MNNNYTCDKQVLRESAGAFFPGDNYLVSARKSQNSAVRGLVVRCLLFNPECSCSNPCVCANFFYSCFEAGFHFFRNYETPPFGFVRLFFENFLMSPKAPPFSFLIFCNRTNKKFQRVPFRFFGTVRLLKILIFSKIFHFSKGPPSIFFGVLQKNGC